MGCLLRAAGHVWARAARPQPEGGSDVPDDERALWYEGPGRAVLRPVAMAAPGAGEVLVRTLQSGVSRGTESLVFQGLVPESEWGRMRAPLQDGDFPFPVKYGYAAVGVVEAGPDALLGRRVFCLHPHQTSFVVPKDAVLAVPDNVPTSRAVLAPQIETAVNAMWDAAPGPGDRIAVIGGGAIGLLVAWLCAALPGAEVTVADPDPKRGVAAAALGVRFGEPPRECDLVVHASGTQEGLAAALALAGLEATVLELSWYGSRTPTVPLGGAFHSRRLVLRGSQVGMVSAGRRVRWSHRRRLALALSLAADARLQALLGDTAPFDDAPAVLPLWLHSAGAIFPRFLYSE
jgi:NADPH:quinone reductase-like Zn-dependent oxidoreductase